MPRERGEHTLQTTSLVHEAYLRLFGSDQVKYNARTHFFVVAARQLRWILVDYGWRVRSEKRGGGQVRFSLEESDRPACHIDEQLLAVDEALSRLQARARGVLPIC